MVVAPNRNWLVRKTRTSSFAGCQTSIRRSRRGHLATAANFRVGQYRLILQDIPVLRDRVLLHDGVNGVVLHAGHKLGSRRPPAGEQAIVVAAPIIEPPGMVE